MRKGANTFDSSTRLKFNTKKKEPPFGDSFLFGGARRDRTADLLRARQALSQLSYGPRNFLVKDS
jgi:hypothetical protein